MRTMTVVSLILNILVLIPITTALALDMAWAARAYGEATPARGILLSIYLAICIVSCVFLFWRDTRMIAALLLVQIIYKVTTPITVGTLWNPVVISNLVIALVHLMTIALVVKAAGHMPETT